MNLSKKLLILGAGVLAVAILVVYLRDTGSRRLDGAVEPVSSGGNAHPIPLVLYAASAESFAALLKGRLTLEGACLYIVKVEGGRFLAAFPSPGTRWTDQEKSIEVGGRVIQLGQMGAFGGGEGTNTPGLDWVAAPAASCGGSKIWMVSSLHDP